MQYALMTLAFAAVAFMVLAFYPMLSGEALTDGAAASARRRHSFYGLILGGVVLAGMLFARIALWKAITVAIIAGGCFLTVLNYWHQRLARRRRILFENRMLDFLMLVCTSMKSGFALPAAVESAARSLGGAIGTEFAVTMGEYRLGMDMAEALRRMNTRVQSDNLQLFTAAVCIAIRTGSSMAVVLERLMFTIRKRNEISDKLNSLTAEFRFEAWVMALMPLMAFLVLYVLDPKLMLPMVTTIPGWCALAVIVILEIVGFKLLNRIVAVKL